MRIKSEIKQSPRFPIVSFLFEAILLAVYTLAYSIREEGLQLDFAVSDALLPGPHKGHLNNPNER